MIDCPISNFPEDIRRFVDLFAGGLNVGINARAEKIYANDQIDYLIDVYRFFQETEINLILKKLMHAFENTSFPRQMQMVICN